MQQGRSASFQPRVEALEDRTLQAAHVTATLSAGLLRLDGTSGADTLVVRRQNNRISIQDAKINVKGVGLVDSVRIGQIERINIRGLEGNDVIAVGADNADTPGIIRIPTRIWGGAGNDRIKGGQGDDKIHGDAGNDQIDGRSGNDTIDGDAGNDRLDGSFGSDLVRGGDGNDVLFGGTRNDRLEGGAGNDLIFAGSGNDRLDGGTGTNQLFGHAGNDVILSRSRRDYVDGGPGRDLAYFLDAAAPRSSGGTLASSIRSVEDFNHPAGTTVAAQAHQAFDEESARLTELTNAYRRSKGLPPLSIDTRLIAAARYQAEYMARTGHYDHVNLDGRGLDDRARAAGYSFSFVGENIHLYDPAVRRTFGIDRAYSLAELPQYYIDGWKVSPGHNANLLSRHPIHVGIAMARDRAGRIYVSQVFGRP